MGFPGSATYMKRSIKELDSTTFWLRALVQYDIQTRLVLLPWQVQAVKQRTANSYCSRCTCSSVPIVLAGYSQATRLQGAKQKSLTFHKHKVQGCAQTRAGRNGQSILVQFRPGREMTNATTSTSFSPTTNITVRGLAIQRLRIDKRLSRFNN